MDISRLEQETIIVFNEAEGMAVVDTCNRALIRQIDEPRRKHTVITETKSDKYGKTYTIPKQWVKIRSPRQLSEKQRQVLQESARKNFHKDMEGDG